MFNPTISIKIPYKLKYGDEEICTWKDLIELDYDTFTIRAIYYDAATGPHIITCRELEYLDTTVELSREGDGAYWYEAPDVIEVVCVESLISKVQSIIRACVRTLLRMPEFESFNRGFILKNKLL